MKFDTFIIGEYVDLVLLDQRVVNKTDWYKWFNHHENTRILEVGKFPNTLKKQLIYVKNELASNDDIISLEDVDKKIQLGILYKKNNSLVGMVSAYKFNYLSRNCFISLITDLRKKKINRLKIFKESQDMMIDHLFYKMNMRKIYSGATDKKLSEMTVKIWGFKLEGIQKKHSFYDGKYHDNFLLGLFREDWEKIKKKKNVKK